MGLIIDYLSIARLPNDREEARKIRNTSARYTLINGKLHRIGHSAVYQRCVGPTKFEYLMKEIYSGVCGNHSKGKAISFKCLRHGYYWPTMDKDTTKFAKKCVKCQQFAKAIKFHLDKLTSIVNAWPIAK